MDSTFTMEIESVSNNEIRGCKCFCGLHTGGGSGSDAGGADQR